ncbi:MAG: aquaporin [Saprospiraceae bacterium]
MIKRCITEFIGTFFLALMVSMSCLSAHPELTPLVAGFTLMAMIYASGHLSGAHFNPAVTLAIFIRGKINLNVVPLYILSQFAGAAFAAILALLLNQGKAVSSIDLSNIPLEAIMAEFIGAFALSYTVLNVATSKNTQGNDYYGIAIGATLIGCAFGLGGISGGAFNPAVAFAFAIGKLSSISNLWIYWVGELTAGILAAVTFLYLNGKD